MLKTALIIVAIAGFALMTGCTRSQQIESELTELRPQMSTSLSRLNSLKSNVTTLQNQSNDLNARYNKNRNATLALIRENPGIVACAASAGVALDDSETFSKDAQEVGAVIGIGCGIAYLFNPEFQGQVDDFVTKINQYSQNGKALQSQIAALKPKLDAETRARNEAQQIYDGLYSKVSSLESELKSLS